MISVMGSALQHCMYICNKKCTSNEVYKTANGLFWKKSVFYRTITFRCCFPRLHQSISAWCGHTKENMASWTVSFCGIPIKCNQIDTRHNISLLNPCMYYYKAMHIRMAEAFTCFLFVDFKRSKNSVSY